MALIRSLNTAVSGLRAQQMRIEVVGNNISNVDTTAFKASRVEFATILSQILSHGGAPGGFLGGIDPTQIGLGTFVGGTPKNFSQGPIEATGVSSHIAVVGDGFFTLRDAAGGPVYSRDGSFTINPANLLHDAATGFIVQGYMADENFAINPGGPLKNLEIPVGVLTIARATTTSSMEGNLNSSGVVASSGTRLFSEALYDSSRPNTRLISSSNPLGLERADATSRLQDLVRSLGDYTASSGGSAGSAATSNFVFPQLQQNPVGLELSLSAEKGERTLPGRTFIVGDPPPAGGVTLGDFVSFVRDSLGVADGILDGSERIEHTYSFARVNPVSGEEVNGTINSTDAAALGALTDLGSDFRGVRTGDYIRFTSGQASGQIAEITGISDSNGDGIPDTLAFRTDGFNALTGVPVEGDTYAIHAPAGVGVSAGDLVAVLSGLTPGAVTTNVDVSSFTVADASVTDFSIEHGLQVGQEVEYLSGGAMVRGTVSNVSGNTVTVSYRSSLSQAPDAGADFAFRSPASGSIEVAGNVGSANNLENVQLFGGGALLPIFNPSAEVAAAGESISTTIVAYDSLGTPREIQLTFTYQSSSANGPNVFRYIAESADDSDRKRVVGSGEVLFNSNGQFVGTGNASEIVSIDLGTSAAQPGGVVSPFQFRLDFSRLTQFSTDVSEVVQRDQDGFQSGTLRDFVVDQTGVIVGIFDNGLARALGQVALARFANPNGLIDEGDNLFSASVNSGIPQVGVAGTFGRGLVRGGFLEESNVDLAQEFTELIIGQRAFQANARTITTSDQLLQELVNLL